MSSRKRSRAPIAAPTAEEEAPAAAAKPKRVSRPAKKAVRTAPEHAVAQAVPAHISGQQSQSEQQRQQPGLAPQQQLNAVAVDPQVALAGNNVTAAVPGHVAATSSQAPASPNGQTQSSHPSALLLLAQQQMQQRLNQQVQLPAGSHQQENSSWSQAPGTSVPSVSALSNGQELGALGNATAQQALLAQLISQQAAQGLNASSSDGSLHPLFSQSLAGAFMRQAIPGQPVSGQDQAQQQLNPQLQQSTAALLLQHSRALQMPQTGMLYPGQVISPGTILPMAYQGQAPAVEQAVPASQVQDVGQHVVAQHPDVQVAAQLPGTSPALPDAASVVQEEQQAHADAQPQQEGAAAPSVTCAPVATEQVGSQMHMKSVRHNGVWSRLCCSAHLAYNAPAQSSQQ